MDTAVTSRNELTAGMTRANMEAYIALNGMSESDRAAKKLMKAFETADVDKDNYISPQEIEAYSYDRQKTRKKNILTGLVIAGGALAIGTAFLLGRKANTKRYDKLLKQYTKLVECKSGDLACCEPYLQYDLVTGKMPQWNMITGNRIRRYPLSFRINWKGYQKLLKEYTELVGGKSGSTSEYAECLLADLKSGQLPKFSCFSGEKIGDANSFIRHFKSFMA